MYDAFISYHHDEASERLAEALQRGLRRLAKPWRRRSALRVFRDKTSLSAGGLRASITEALDSSEWLVVLCSPEAEQSEWVGEEIGHWTKAGHPHGRILPVLVDGTFEWDDRTDDIDWTSSTAAPRALAGAFEVEPKYVDLRWATDKSDLNLGNPDFLDAVAGVAAPIHGIAKDELEGEDIRRHRRASHIRRLAVAMLVMLTVAAAIAGLVALQNARRADEEATRATQEADRATQEAGRANAAEDDAVEQRDIAEAEAERATNEAEIAESRRLAAESLLQRDDHRDLALLLAVEAYETRPTPDAANAVFAALVTDSERIVLRQGHDDEVTKLSSESDVGTIASHGNDGRLIVWDIASAEPIWNLDTGMQWVLDLELSSDGTTVAISGDGRVRIWNLVSGVELAPFELESAFSVALTSDGRQLAVASVGGMIVLADTVDGSVIASVNIGGLTGALAFDPQGERVAVTSMTDVSVWTPLGLDPLVTLYAADDYMGINDPQFDSLGQIIGVTYSSCNAVVLFDADTGAIVSSTPCNDGAVTFDPDLRMTANWDDSTLVIRDLATSKSTTTDAALSGIGPLRFAQETGMVVGGRRDGSIVFRSLGAGQPFGSVIGQHDGAVTAVAASADGSRAASGGEGGELWLWDLTTTPIEGIRLAGLDGVVESVAISPDGSMVVSGGSDGTLRFWSADGTAIEDPWEHDEPVEAVAIDPSGRLVAYGLYSIEGADQIVVWDMSAREHRAWFTTDIIGPLAFSPDGLLLASGGAPLHVWDLDTGELVERIEGLSAESNGVAFAPDAGLLVVADKRSVIELATTGDERRILDLALEGIPTSVDYSADGRFIAWSTWNTITVWDRDARRPMGEPFATQGSDVDGGATVLAFALGGDALVSGGGDGTVRRWDLRADAWVDLACELAGRNLDLDEWTRLVGDAADHRETCPGYGL